MTEVDNNPCHPYEPDELLAPGETLREALDALGLTQRQLADRTGLSVKHTNQIIQGQAPITHETAIALERVTGVPARFWNALEADYQDFRARSAESLRVEDYAKWLKGMPTKYLRRVGFIKSDSRDLPGILRELLQFFGVANVDAWNRVWLKPEASFLQSPAFEARPGAVAAWLRCGELSAQQIQCGEFDRAALRSALPELREMTLLPFESVRDRVVDRCAEVGVAVTFVAEVPGARASGASRWLSPNKALVQLSDRGKRNDKIWFALFHELGHVLLHGKRDVFLDENLDAEGDVGEKEQEANNFAQNTLIPPEHFEDLARVQTVSEVRSLARQIGVGPAIVAGRVQRDRKDYRFATAVFESFSIDEP